MHLQFSRIILRFFFICAFFFTSQGAFAVPTSEEELAMLPPYCNARIKGVNEQLWKSKFSLSGWAHLHHYCGGLNAINRANLATNREKREKYLKGSIGSFNYVLQHGDSSFILLPELHTKKGESFVRLGEYSHAMAEFYKAIEINPKYTKSYVGLSKLYATQGKKKEATEVIQQGLKHKPNSKSLKRQLNKVQAK